MPNYLDFIYILKTKIGYLKFISLIKKNGHQLMIMWEHCRWPNEQAGVFTVAATENTDIRDRKWRNADYKQ